MRRENKLMRLFLQELKMNRKSFLIWLFAVAGMCFGCILLYGSVEASMADMSDMYSDMGAMSVAFGMDRISIATLEELGYGVSYAVLNAKYFGVPQNRERLFIIAWYKDLINAEEFKFPYGIDAKGNTIFDKESLKRGTMPTKVSDIFEPEDVVEAFTISDRMWAGHQARKERNKANGKGFGYSKFYGDSVYCSTISARYWKDGSEILIDQEDKNKNPRTLTPVEAGRLQGYRIIGHGWQHPECANNQNYNDSNLEFRIVVSKKEAYHQFGNSVAVPVIKRLAQEIMKQLIK